MQVNKLRQETTKKHHALAPIISYLSDDHLKTIAEVNMFTRMILIFKLRSINRNTNSETMLFK